MSRRVCLVPGCPALTDRGRCTTHRREVEQARGSSTARGYDYAHQTERKSWAPYVATGTVRCRRCQRLLDPDEPWHLGHPDKACPRPKAPECEPCNTSAPRHAA